MTIAPPIIETRGLTKRFGSRTAVSDINLTVPAGCAFGFLGHNGAGKTTVIRMLVNLTRPSAGIIRIGGQPLASHREQVLARVGAIVEEPRFHPHLTGRENLRVVAAVRGPQARRRIEPALERAGLRDRGDNRVGTYSQGMRQRLGIARCLLADPKLVILDEPMNGLDPAGILELRELIAGLVTEGRTVFISSHLLDEIEKTCHAAAVIDKGRLIAQAPISELIGDTHTHYELTCDNPQVALRLLAWHPAVVQSSHAPGGRQAPDGSQAPGGRQAPGALRVTLADPRAAGVVATLLTEAGLTVTGFAPVRTSLADRFLGLTSRVGDNS